MENNKIDNEQIINQIINLKKEINESIENIGDAQNSVFEHLKKKSLESKVARLEKIEEIFNIDKYKIVFIGTIGAGKTTAICHLFNLIGKFEKKEEKNNKTTTITKTEPLLSTASGRTTISEVIIKPGKRTYIEIEPYQREEVEEFINDFCDSLYQGDSAEGETTAAELERAIRSFTNLKKTKLKDKFGKEKFTDLAKVEAKKRSNEELKQLALTNAELDDRFYTKDESKLFCPEGGDEKEWLKKNFDNINRGEEKSFSIPKQIFVHVSPNVLGESQLSLFDSVIDTKGIDENPNRADLRDYIEQEDSICLFTTRYNDAPEANIRELFKYYLPNQSKQFQHRFVTFVMPHKGEPEKENDGDDTWDTGISIKQDVILDVLKKLNLEFLEDNILFFDSLRYYDEKNRLMSEYTDDDTQENKNDIIYRLGYVIEQRKEFLRNEINEIGENFLSIINGQALSEEDIKTIQTTFDKLKLLSDINLRLPSFVYEEFIERFVDYYSSHYPAWNTKDAIHRRYGVYEFRGYDTYYDAKVVSGGVDEEEMLRKFTKEIKDEVIQTIEDLGETHPDLKTLTPEIITRFQIAYDNFIDEVGDSIEQHFRQYNDNLDFWNNLINRRGKGKGYNEDVCNMLEHNLGSVKTGLSGGVISANRLLQEFTERHWKTAINSVLGFFS